MRASDPTEEDEQETAAATALLLKHHPAARLDDYGRVITGGFLCSPGAPGTAKVRVSHRTPFPSVLNGISFADAAAEEYVLVDAYADLLRADGWTVRDRTTNRPRILAFRPATPLGN